MRWLKHTLMALFCGVAFLLQSLALLPTPQQPSHPVGGASSPSFLILQGTNLVPVLSSWVIGTSTSKGFFNSVTSTNYFVTNFFFSNATGTSVTSTNLSVYGTAKLPTTTLSGHQVFSSGAAVSAGNYEFGRDNSATNILYTNVPTGGAYSWKINGTQYLSMDSSGRMTFTNSGGFAFNVSQPGGGCTGNPAFSMDDGVRTAEMTICSSELLFGTYNAIPMSFITNQTKRMTIDSVGLITLTNTTTLSSIGVTVPLGKLHIVGINSTAAANALYIANSSLTNIFKIDNVGNMYVAGTSTLATTTISNDLSITSRNVGQCTLNGGAPATCTATVPSTCSKPQCTVSSGAGTSIPLCAAAAGTLTVTAAAGDTDVINYFCP